MKKGAGILPALLNDLAKSYELVVVDSPAPLAVIGAQLSSRLVENSVLLVLWAQAAREFALAELKQPRYSRTDIARVALAMDAPKEHRISSCSDACNNHRSTRSYYKGLTR